MLSADAVLQSARLLDVLRAIPEGASLPTQSLKSIAELYVLSSDFVDMHPELMRSQGPSFCGCC